MQGLRKLTAIVSKTKCSIIFINQIREKIGVFYGPSETTTGGRALKFYASVRLDIRRKETLKAAGEVSGNRVKVKVVKNKVAPPFRECEFDIIFGKGISAVNDVIDNAVELGIMQKSGAWYSYNGSKVGQGKDNTRVYLENNTEIFTEIEEQVRAKIFSEHTDNVVLPPPEAETNELPSSGIDYDDDDLDVD